MQGKCLSKSYPQQYLISPPEPSDAESEAGDQRDMKPVEPGAAAQLRSPCSSAQGNERKENVQRPEGQGSYLCSRLTVTESPTEVNLAPFSWGCRMQTCGTAELGKAEKCLFKKYTETFLTWKPSIPASYNYKQMGQNEIFQKQRCRMTTLR